MSKIATITLLGVAGECYEFGVYPFNHSFPPVGAVYYISKRTTSGDHKGSHTSLYIGQNGDISARFKNNRKQSCIVEHGANSIRLHVDNNETSRLDKERDFLSALQPLCND